MTDRVLITGARAPAALGLARAFRAAGFEPHLADCCPAFVARASRASARVHAYAGPRSDPGQFASDLSRLATELKPRLIVPTCEEIFHLAPVAEAGGFAERLLAPTAAVLRRLHSKHAFAQACIALGVPAPPSARVTDAGALADEAREPGQCVVKREFSRFGVQTLVGPDPEALARIRPTATEPWVVQRRLSGEEVSFYAVCLGGRLTAFSAYRSTWKLPGGAGYAFEALDGAILEQLRSHAAALAAGLVGQGQFACDAIVEPDGRASLIECNPRSTSGVHLFARPERLAAAMLGAANATELIPAADLRPAMWRYGLPEALRTGRVAAWRKQVRQGEDVIGAPRDRLPLAGALVDTLVFARRARRGGQSLEAAMTADIEWNGDAP